ncbi:hypothetical protein RUM43_009093 [Polyplax serrata]|uniref:Uncharacterized protein n=1 Tax=Polyplax serrata TaxID=468196 RepID=A0AAN8NZ86_POLSC
MRFFVNFQRHLIQPEGRVVRVEAGLTSAFRVVERWQYPLPIGATVVADDTYSQSACLNFFLPTINLSTQQYI